MLANFITGLALASGWGISLMAIVLTAVAL